MDRPDHVADSALVQRLQAEVEGVVYFDALSRGRYSIDASMYQVFPIGVVVPRHAQDVVCALQIAAESGVPVYRAALAPLRGGNMVGKALVLDTSKHLTAVRHFEPGERTIPVEPGMALGPFGMVIW
ncbi:MAG: FAD-binding protein [Gammaproteobacteria bacterium]